MRLKTVLDAVYTCATPTMSRCHEQLHVFLAGLNKAGYRSRTLHGRALKHEMPLIIKSMQVAPLEQALGPGNPCAPAQHNGQWVAPHPETQQCTPTASAKRLHHQRTRLPQALSVL